MAGVWRPQHLLPQVQKLLQGHAARRPQNVTCQGVFAQAGASVCNESCKRKEGDAGQPCMNEAAENVQNQGKVSDGAMYDAPLADKHVYLRRHGHLTLSDPANAKQCLHNARNPSFPYFLNTDVASNARSALNSGGAESNKCGLSCSSSSISVFLPSATNYVKPSFPSSRGANQPGQPQSFLSARTICSKSTATEADSQDGSKGQEAVANNLDPANLSDQDVLTDALKADGTQHSDILMEHLEMDDDLDHPTDADLDRALGEPTSNANASDGTKEGSSPKVSIEATKLFNRVWNQVVNKMGGIESLNIPKEIVWLNGAPGSGKGANTPFILQTRGFPTKAISISSLLQDDQQAQEIMKSGALLSDSHVLELVLEGILKMGFMDSPDEEGDEIPDEDEIIAGVVVDGFPRTTMQVDFVKLLNDKLADLHYQHLNTPQEHHFPRPIFRIAVLYVEEEESVRRQLHRGKAALQHNQRVKQSGLGDLVEVRETDLDERAARRRYQIFREHYDTLLRLKSFFPFHLIDAMGTLAQCREQIADELQYQSGLELGEDTFRAICHLPLAKNLVKQARQNMVTRLDAYMKHDLHTFRAVTDVIEHEVIPIVRKCALAGVALYNTEQPLFFKYPEASEMLADVLSERGYYVTWQTRTREIPVKVDLTTGAITCEKRVSLQFRIKFDRPIIRNPTLNVTAEEKS